MEPSLSSSGRRETDQPPGSLLESGTDRVETVERTLHELQDRYPTAPMLALDVSGLIVEMPDSVPRRDNPVLSGRSALDGVPAENHKRVIETFDRVIAEGYASCVLHLPGYAELMYHGFDLRERHGVLISLLTQDGSPRPAPPPDLQADVAPLRPPRFATIRKDERSFVIGIGGGLTEILGWSTTEMTGRRSLDFVHADDRALAIDNWMDMLGHPGPSRRVRQRLRHKDGSWVWFEITNHNLLADPDHRCVVAELLDISEEMAAQEALREREQLLNRLAEAIPVGLLQVDIEGRTVYTNDRLHEILGVKRAPTVQEQLATILPDDRSALERAIESVLNVGSHADIEVACRHSGDEDLRFCTISFRALRHDDDAISGAIACVADVTESARMREELTFRATFDELTGCHNRASIMAALEADIERDRRRAERALMFIDLDGFKSVNDRYGHAAGDELLREVARLLRDSVRDKDLVGRTGGDEFLIMCPDVGGIDGAMKLAGRLTRVLRDGMSETAGQPACSVSIGVAWSSGNATGADALVAAADHAMYECKRAGNGEPKLA